MPELGLPESIGTPEQVLLVDDVEADAWADWYASMPAEIAQRLKTSVETFGSATGITTGGFRISLFNRVIGLGNHEPATADLLDRVRAHYEQFEVNYSVQVSPAARPETLGELLVAREFEPMWRMAKVLLRRDAPTEKTPLKVEEAGPDQAELFGRLRCQGFGMPEELWPITSGIIGRHGWSNVIAYDGGRPISVGSLFIGPRGAWLGGGATPKEFRGHGGQRATMLARIAAARRETDIVVTETGEDRPDSPNPSFHNMLATGFELVSVAPQYLRVRFR